MTKRILIFPCGSEIGLEIHRSLRFSTHFELVGASSVEDHGRFIFSEYIGDLPLHNDPTFPLAIRKLVRKQGIDAIYPTMDAVANTLMKLGGELGVRIIGSSPETTAICASKLATYQALLSVVPVPEVFPFAGAILEYPVFLKPDRGYGARNTLLANNEAQASEHLARFEKDEMIIVENLPGQEWTIDCFSDRHGNLIFHGPRIRGRISNGISVHTQPSNEFTKDFAAWAQAINQKLHPRGAWFFQMKQDRYGQPKLLEVAARLGGSSALYRCLGINFALLSIFDAFDNEVTIRLNSYQIEMDRALGARFRLNIDYQTIYVDLDDCLILKGVINHQLLAFLYKAFSEGKTINLLTRHEREPLLTLKEYRISELFDRVIHLTDKAALKSDYINESRAIFIDDSYAERTEVSVRCDIPVFSPDMIEALI
jgi:hypothetical protein